MSIVIGGRRIATAFESICWLDDAALAPYVTDHSPRTRRVRTIVLHTVKGINGPVRGGLKPSTRAEVYARYQTRAERAVSWDATLDTDGTLIWQNDPLADFCYHATAWNPISLGIELVQDADGSLYDGQLQTLVRVLDTLTAHLGIQRQIPWGATGLPRGVVDRLDEHGHQRGSDYVGVAAHFMNTESRGRGDTSVPFEYLRRAGYECVDMPARSDLELWKSRQFALGMSRQDRDGIPLDKTVALLKQNGHRLGLWIERPGDDEIQL